MGHDITAIILKGDFDKNLAKEFDLREKYLGFTLNLFHIDIWYAACWQHLLKTEGELEIKNIDCIGFPTDAALAEIMKKISGISLPQYAIIKTDYFGGMGFQWASVFQGKTNADFTVRTINQALRYLGVTKKNGLDEFETVGLDKIRVQPDYLDKYRDLYDELGLY